MKNIKTNYRVHNLLKKRIKEAGVDMRDLSNHIGEPPGTLSNRLNGWIQLPSEMHAKINRYVQMAENKPQDYNHLSILLHKFIKKICCFCTDRDKDGSMCVSNQRAASSCLWYKCPRINELKDIILEFAVSEKGEFVS